MSQAQKNKKAQKEIILSELTPKREISQKDSLSNFKVKDEFFDKEKSYYDRTSKQAKTTEVFFRNLHVGGQAIVAYLGEPITKNELASFDADAKKHWLTSIGKKAKAEENNSQD